MLQASLLGIHPPNRRQLPPERLADRNRIVAITP